MNTSSKWIVDALNRGMNGEDYLSRIIGMSTGSLTFRKDAANLDQTIEEAKTFRDDLIAKAKEDGWAEYAARDNIDAESFINMFEIASPQWTEWQHAVARATLGKMIEAEQEARKAAKPRENDLMEVTDSAAA